MPGIHACSPVECIRSSRLAEIRAVQHGKLLEICHAVSDPRKQTLNRAVPRRSPPSILREVQGPRSCETKALGLPLRFRTLSWHWHASMRAAIFWDLRTSLIPEELLGAFVAFRARNFCPSGAWSRVWFSLDFSILQFSFPSSVHRRITWFRDSGQGEQEPVVPLLRWSTRPWTSSNPVLFIPASFSSFGSCHRTWRCR